MTEVIRWGMKSSHSSVSVENVLPLVTCCRCGWVHFAMSLDQVEHDVHRFNTFYDAAPTHVKECYHQRSSVDNYKHCDGCGGSYKNFREYRNGDCPDGVTIGPILEAGA